MNTTSKFTGILPMIFLGQWSMAALGAHSLLTEVTGTQGVGQYQLEITHGLSHQKDAATETGKQ